MENKEIEANQILDITTGVKHIQVISRHSAVNAMIKYGEICAQTKQSKVVDVIEGRISEIQKGRLKSDYIKNAVINELTDLLTKLKEI